MQSSFARGGGVVSVGKVIDVSQTSEGATVVVDRPDGVNTHGVPFMALLHFMA